jgi:hypothetical protein
MEIIFSRHAKRRIKLYDLSETKIKEIITKNFLKHFVNNEKAEMVNEGLKIIVKIGTKEITVITAYPFGKKVTR